MQQNAFSFVRRLTLLRLCAEVLGEYTNSLPFRKCSREKRSGTQPSESSTTHAPRLPMVPFHSPVRHPRTRTAEVPKRRLDLMGQDHLARRKKSTSSQFGTAASINMQLPADEARVGAACPRKFLKRPARAPHIRYGHIRRRQPENVGTFSSGLDSDRLGSQKDLSQDSFEPLLRVASLQASLA